MQTNNDSNNHEVHPNFIRTNMEYNNAMSMRKGATIRDVLGSKAELTTLPLVPTLSSLMAHRIEGISLLPATQDEQANQEAMDDTLVAITLTPTAFCAAHVYAQLLGMPGAWGSGLNDMEALSCLAAVIRRWSVECRGREHGIAAYMGAKKKQGPQGRKRRADMMEFGDDEYFNDGGSFQSDFNAVSPRALVLSGLEAAQALVKIPIQIEFMSWSYESREVLLDAVVCCLATAAALTSRQRGGHKQEEDGKIQELSQTTVVVASDSLARCITMARAPSSDNKTEVNSCYHETAVLILRGLTSLLCSKGDTPNGEAGKQGAHSAALATLENLVKAVAQDFAESTTSRTTATPRHAREVTMTSQTPRTAKSSRKSLGNVVNEVPTPAALKGGATPNRRSSIGRTSQILHHRPRPILSAILGMLQKLATDSNSIERANVRERTVATLTRCMPHFPVLEREYLIRFFIQMCQSKLPVHRLVAVDIAGAVLAETWFWNDHSRTPFSAGSNVKGTPASLRVSLSPRSVVEKNAPSALLGALQGRMLDRVPAVRARTAACLVSFLRSLCRCDKWESASAASAALEDCVSACSTSLHDVLSNRALTDDKATVRKSSIDALAALLLFCEAQELDHLRLSVVDASLLERLSRDTSLITRKAAADGISLLTEKCFKSETAWRPIEEVFERAWLNAILPMMLDVETTCVSKAVELFTGLVIEPILDEKEHRRSQTAWRLLSYIGEISGKTVAAAREVEAIKVALAKLRASETSRGEITLQLMKVICRFASTTLDGEQEHLQAFGDHVECQRTGVWVLFDAFVDDPKVVATIAILVRKKQINVDFIATIWKLMLLMLSQQTTPPKSTNKLRGSLISCLRILSKLASCVGTDRAQRAAEQLAVTLQTFSAPTEVAGFAISSVIAITLSVYADEDATTARKKCKEWIVNLLQECEFCISTSLENAVNGELRVEDELLLARALFICGQLSIVGFCLDEDVITKSASQLTQASDIMVSGLHIPPSPTLINLVMTMLSKTLPTKSMVLTPNSVRALAYVTLGKFCLRDEGLAKQSLPIFAGQIQANLEDACPSVQSNALLIMGDLCVRYTNMVDRYLPLMASCLQFGLEDDANNIFEERSHRGAVVRKHAVVLLSSLLLQDYIKWRGLLFQRFLVAAADMDDEVANIASATLCGPLLTRHPKLFFNQFVESLFVLNRCTAHPIYKAAAATGDGGAGIAVGFDGINLTGEPGRTRRHQMYGMMLSKMTDEEKIGITSRVAKEVLGAAIEGEGDLGRVCRAPTLDSETDERYLGAREVMRDAFAILTPMLRIRHSAAADDTEETELENTSQRVAVAKNRLLSKISSKHLIEIILPKLCTLKTVMQASQSPLLKDLMSYLVEVFRAYKREVKEFLADDPVLLQEIEFDARKFKSSQSKNHD
jgi:condensin-2 complex subunit D3